MFKREACGLVKKGYAVIPIRPNSKRPLINDWTNSYADTVQACKNMAQGISDGCGVGVVTTDGVCAIDVDVLDSGIAKQIHEYLEENLQTGFVYRTGLAPKFLVPCRTSSITSKKLTKEVAGIGKIEVLSVGQQFVALGIHEDTNKEYIWSDSIPAVDGLPMFNLEDLDKLFDFFYKITESQLVAEEDFDDDFGNLKAGLHVTHDYLEQLLEDLPISIADDYRLWVKVGMALHHQYDGGKVGFELWDKFSKRSTKYPKEKSEVVEKWDSFSEDRKGELVTVATLIMMARQAIREETDRECLALEERLFRATSSDECEDIIAAARRVRLSKIQHTRLANATKIALERLTGVRFTLSEVRSMLSYKPNTSKLPDWLEGWVYMPSENKFFNYLTDTLCTPEGFHGMLVKTATRFFGELKKPVGQIVLETYDIPHVAGETYDPSQPELFEEFEDGSLWANRYRANTLPQEPAELSEDDWYAIGVVLGHIDHMIAEPEYREIVRQWLAWQVQHAGELVLWSIVLQGIQGDGKTSFRKILELILGRANVGVVSNAQLQKNFNSWASGHAVNFVEELNLSGVNKYDQANSMKEYITNDRILIDSKNRTPKDVRNTTNYFFVTNHKSSLPIDDAERRYFVLFSKWQDRAALAAFRKENPDYYENLYKVLNNVQRYGGGVRKFFKEYEISDSFRKLREAPNSIYKQSMVRSSMGEEQQVLYDVLVESKFLMNRELFDFTYFAEKHLDQDEARFSGRKWAKILETAHQMTYLGRLMIDGHRHRFYSANPNHWMKNGRLDRDKIRAFVGDTFKDDDEIWNEDNDKPKFTRNIDDL